MTDRGHVPFALLGVLILITSVALASSVHQPVSREVGVDREIERVTAEIQTTLRETALATAHDAAQEPVIEPADTTVGDALREDRAFADALRLRMYLQLRDRFDRLGATREDLTVTVSLPETQTRQQVKQAIRRVSLTPVSARENSLRVRVDGVRLSATRDGHTVAERALSPTVVVDTPVFTVHERVNTFEKQLQGGMFDGGLGERLTTRLYPIAWARGYAQYSGAPIQQVVSNRHVGLLTNSALLELQSETFGASDPVGREALGRTATAVGLTDLLAGIDDPSIDHLKDVRAHAGLDTSPTETLDSITPDSAHPTPEEEVTHGINETAESVFLGFLRPDVSVADFLGNNFVGSKKPDLKTFDETLNTSFTETVRLDTRVKQQTVTAEHTPEPSSHWIPIDRKTEEGLHVTQATRDPPESPQGWRRLEHYPRDIRHTERETIRWRVGNETRTTTRTKTTTYSVDLTLVGRLAGPAPQATVRTIHEPGGPFDGPNMADVVHKAQKTVVEERGGPDQLAVRAAMGRLKTEPVQLRGAYPKELRGWIYSDLTGLREEIADITTTTTRGEMATYETNVPAELLETLNERRRELVATPEVYDNVSHRALIGARVAYLDRVAWRLAVQSDEHATNRDELADELSDSVGDSVDAPLKRMQRGLAIEPNTDSPDDTAVTMRVDTDPSYLPREAVGRELLPTLPPGGQAYPLVVRNVNLVSAPYGELVRGILGIFSETERTTLHTTAEVLSTTESAVDDGLVSIQERSSFGLGLSGDLDGLRRNKIPRLWYLQLRHSVSDGVEHLVDEAISVLAAHELGNGQQREQLVADALSDWETPSSRALALTNGSGPDAIVKTALDRWGRELSENQADLLAVQLRAGIRRARQTDNVRPPVSRVKRVEESTVATIERAAADRLEDTLQNLTDRTFERVTGRTLSSLPQGVPIAVPPLPWLATANYWSVEVRGTYPRFTVRVPQGSPQRPGAELVYMRDGQPVRLDVTGDGSPETLGTASRVQFEARTDIAVAVPAGPRGVGDVDGEMSEESPGWPRPGPRT